MNGRQILVITGPTASGKSALAIRLAENLGGEIINADSVQVYRDFCIGSGAPSEEEFNRVPHHLFGILDAREDWNAGLFRNRTSELIRDIIQRQKLPIITGGTGLYIRSLLSGLADISVSDEAKTKVAQEERSREAAGLSPQEITAALYDILASLDATSAAKIGKSDSQRIRRALAVCFSGSSLAVEQERHAQRDEGYDAAVFCILPDRALLYAAIERRVDEMVTAGFLQEVEKLLRTYSPDLKPLRTIGYREAVLHLQGQLSENEFRAEMKQSTRRFAKRQETWWRHQPESLDWKVQGERAEARFLTVLETARSYLPGSSTITGSGVRFYPFSGVGFREDLG